MHVHLNVIFFMGYIETAGTARLLKNDLVKRLFASHLARITDILTLLTLFFESLQNICIVAYSKIHRPAPSKFSRTLNSR